MKKPIFGVLFLSLISTAAFANCLGTGPNRVCVGEQVLYGEHGRIIEDIIPERSVRVVTPRTGGTTVRISGNGVVVSGGAVRNRHDEFRIEPAKLILQSSRVFPLRATVERQDIRKLVPSYGTLTPNATVLHGNTYRTIKFIAFNGEVILFPVEWSRNNKTNVNNVSRVVEDCHAGLCNGEIVLYNDQLRTIEALTDTGRVVLVADRWNAQEFTTNDMIFKDGCNTDYDYCAGDYIYYGGVSRRIEFITPSGHFVLAGESGHSRTFLNFRTHHNHVRVQRRIRNGVRVSAPGGSHTHVGGGTVIVNPTPNNNRRNPVRRVDTDRGRRNGGTTIVRPVRRRN